MADHEVFADHLGQGIFALFGPVQGLGHPLLDLGVDGIAHQVEHVLFGCDVFVERPDGDARRPGNLAGGGLVEPIIDEQVHRCIHNLSATLSHQRLILDQGRDSLRIGIFLNHVQHSVNTTVFLFFV
jgi:hypothetical protein